MKTWTECARIQTPGYWAGYPHWSRFLAFYALLFYELILCVMIYRLFIDSHEIHLIAFIKGLLAWFILVLLPLIWYTIKHIQFRWIFIGVLYLALSISAYFIVKVSYAFQAVLLLFIIAGIIWIEKYRRSFRFYINRNSIAFCVRGIKKWERHIAINKISDIILEQGILGRIFNVGDIIPVTNSGFGLGNDAVLTAGAVSVGKIFRLTGSAVLGSIRSQNRPRVENQFKLYGIKDPEKIIAMINSLYEKTYS